MEGESDSPCSSHTHPGQECRSPRRGSGWELEFRDCGAVPGRGLWEKAGQTGLLIPSYKRLEKRLWQGHTPVAEAVHVPASQAAGPPSRSTLKGQSGHRRKKSCIWAHRVSLVMSSSLWPCGLWPARLLCQGGGFSRQEHWSILANAVAIPF